SSDLADISMVGEASENTAASTGECISGTAGIRSTGGGVSETGGACTTGGGAVHEISSIGCAGAGGGCSNAGTGGAPREGTRKTSGSNGIRGADCKALVTNRDRTSSVAANEAGHVCA